MRKTVAVAMIVKNEEALLARCLESVKDADSIWILDTGSQDKTVEIARKYTPNVFLDFIWNDSFCDAQNFLLDKLRGKSDWILSIDADEFCHDFSEVRKAIELGRDMIRVGMVAEGGQRLEFGFGRLFRNSPDIFWVQPIHKHLNLPGEGEHIGNVKITFGWSPAHANDPDRALRILEQVVKQEGDSAGRNLYYLGREYWYKQRYKECTATLGRYVQVSNWPAEKAEAFLIMSQSYSAQGLDEDARDACLQAIKINSNFKEAIVWMAGISTKENVSQWKRMAKTANNMDILWDRMPAEPIKDIIFISPYGSIEAFYGSYILMRIKPLVIIVCDSFNKMETLLAMKLIGCPVLFMDIHDTQLTDENLKERLHGINPEIVYAPAVQGADHRIDIVGRVAFDLFGKQCERYATYSKTDRYTTSNFEIIPTHSEMELKNKVLECYSAYSDHVKNKSEWLV
jgi:glycosyltransferase involved in cell wall biosynthesis